MKILLADDSRAMRLVFRDVFQKLGHSSTDILEAPDWPSALAALRTDPIDLLVFDWELPGMDGSDLMWALKELGADGKATVLFVVSRQHRPLVAQTARQGPCEFIEKPFTPEAFAAKVRALGSAFEAKIMRESSKMMRPVHTSEPEAPPRFLTQLPANVLEDLLKLATSAFNEAGVTLLRAGEVCGALRFVLQGQAEILEGAAGKLARVVEEGDPFGELSFMTLQPSAETVRARTRVQTASLSKKSLSELLRKQPAMGIYLSALMNRHTKTMAARATTLEHSDFKGTFDTMPFADVIQMLIATKKTGVLGVRSEEDRGAVYLEEGEAIHAWTDTLKGDQAFYVIAGMSTAKFAFSSIQRREPRTLTQPTITLLMNAMRRLEKTSR